VEGWATTRSGNWRSAPGSARRRCVTTRGPASSSRRPAPPPATASTTTTCWPGWRSSPGRNSSAARLEVADLVAVWDGQQCGRAATLPPAAHRRAPHGATPHRRAVRVRRPAANGGQAARWGAGRWALRRGLCLRHRNRRSLRRGGVGDAGRQAGRRSDRLHARAGRDAGPARRLEHRVGSCPARIAAPSGSLRIEFGHDVDLGELARLVAAEQHCCAFLSFAVTVDDRGAALEVRAPEAAAGIVAELFGQPA
jgi:hypothetical protein